MYHFGCHVYLLVCGSHFGLYMISMDFCINITTIGGILKRSNLHFWPTFWVLSSGRHLRIWKQSSKILFVSAKFKVSWFLFINNKTSLSNVNIDLVNEKTKKEGKKQTNKQTNKQKQKRATFHTYTLLYYVHSILNSTCVRVCRSWGYPGNGKLALPSVNFVSLEQKERYKHIYRERNNPFLSFLSRTYCCISVSLCGVGNLS